MVKIGNYQIPFDEDGNQQHYPEHWVVGSYPDAKRVGPDWRDNAPFFDTLTFDTYSRGRSAAYFHFKKADGKGVCMFLKEMTAAIPHMVHGKLSGEFQFIKRGENYGIILQRPV